LDTRFTILFLSIPIFAAAYFFLHYLWGTFRPRTAQKKSKILRAEKRKMSAEESFWHGIATSLFEQAGETITQDVRIESALKAGATRLGLGHALLLRHMGENCQILSMASTGYAKPLRFHLGEEVSRNLLFNSHLSKTREMITIDFASLSEWRKHPSHRDLGWESFIAHYQEGVLEHPISLCFFDSRPRDHLYGKQEKDFVVQLGKWVFTILQNDTVVVANADKALIKETKLASIS
jgi:hypothetical protein